jgi:hypothetical protein
MSGKDFRRFFQVCEAEDTLVEAILNQVATEQYGRYLYFMTLFQIPAFVNTLHRVFVANALLKRSKFLRPQPPYFFGFAITSHLQR